MSETVDTSEFGAPDLAAARDAGASNLFVLIAAIDPAAVKVGHNYVARKLAMYDDVAEVRETAGHFMSALWDGDLAEALYRADATNTKLLIRTLNDDVIMSALIADRGSVESAESWFEPHRERYGWTDDLLNSE